MNPRFPIDALPPTLIAGDAYSSTVTTKLEPGSVVFIVISGVSRGQVRRMYVGGDGSPSTADGVTTYDGEVVAEDQSVTFTLASSDTAAWAKGRFGWVALWIDPATGNREKLSTGSIRIQPNPTATLPDDPRTHVEIVLDQLRAVMENRALDDVAIYKIGGREVTKMPIKDVMYWIGIYEGKLRRQKRRQGKRAPSQNIGITFGGPR